MKHLTNLLLFVAAIGLAGCSSNKNDQESSLSTDSTSLQRAYSSSGSGQKLVKTAKMSFKVKDVTNCSKLISDKVRRLGGMITSQNIENIGNNSKTIKLSDDSLLQVHTYITKANVTVRVPSLHLEDFMDQVRSLSSFLDNSTLQIDDKSIDYLAAQLKQQNRENLIPRAEKKAGKSGEVTDLITTKDELINQKISNQKIDYDVKYSTLELSFYQNELISKETVANSDLSSYRQPFFHQFVDSVKDGWFFFLDVLIALSRLWVFLLLILFSWFAVRYIKTRRKLFLRSRE